MKAYLDILKEVKEHGAGPHNKRTGIPDIGLAYGATFIHDMNNGFPLLTTKKMGLKNIATELEFFLRGITDKKWLQDRKCHIWDEWANPVKVEKRYKIYTKNIKNMSDDMKYSIKFKIMDEERDLGPIYGFQWRHFGGEYEWDQSRIEKNPEDNFNPRNPGIDQVKLAIEKLKKSPNDRRIIVSAWNPMAMNQMALPPCHMMHHLIVKENRISLIWTQRSCDLFLGVPYNIASYALLLLLYAKETGLKPGFLKGELHDVHIYTNHLAQVQEQLSRKPYPLPTVEIPDDNWKGMLNWSAKDGFVLKNYICHEKIQGDVAR